MASGVIRARSTVEITSLSNSQADIEHKVELYLARGAVEVWVIDEDGGVAIHGHIGKSAESEIVPGFAL